MTLKGTSLGSISFILLQSDWPVVIGQLYTPPVRLAGTSGSAFSLGAPTNSLFTGETGETGETLNPGTFLFVMELWDVLKTMETMESRVTVRDSRWSLSVSQMKRCLSLKDTHTVLVAMAMRSLVSRPPWTFSRSFQTLS